LGFYRDFLNFFEKVFLREIKGGGIQSDCRGARKKRKRPFIPEKGKERRRGGRGREDGGCCEKLRE
jgi:hypothetical protein